MNQTKKDVIRFGLLFLAVVILAFTVWVLQENAKVIKSDPLIYGMNVHGFNSCSCIDEEGNTWFSDGQGFKSIQQIGDSSSTNFKVNFTNTEVNENRTSRNT